MAEVNIVVNLRKTGWYYLTLMLLKLSWYYPLRLLVSRNAYSVKIGQKEAFNVSIGQLLGRAIELYEQGIK